MVAALSLIVLLIGFFAAELWKANLVASHLRNSCDSASVAAAVRLVSAHEDNPAEARSAAKKLAIEVLRSNSVAGNTMENASERSIDELRQLSPGDVAFNIDFLDEKGLASPTGKHVRVQAAYGTPPLSGKLIGLSTYLVKAEGHSAAAKLDLAFCLDNSLSMATDTPCGLYQRMQDYGGAGSNPNGVNYVTVMPPALRNTAGSGLIEPLYCSVASKKFQFNATMRCQRDNIALDQGTLPGNKPGDTIASTSFTDRVIVPSSGEFSNPFVALEAQRGNLDSLDNFEKSGAKQALAAYAPGFSWQPGKKYKELYEKEAAPLVQPYSKAKQEIKNFFDLMERNTDSHFALIPFSAGAASEEGGKAQQWRVAPRVGDANQTYYPFGKVELNKHQSKYSKVKSEIDTYRLFGGTDTPAAIREAIKTLSNDNFCRSDARKAMLVFTDGEPAAPSYPDGAIPETLKAAKEAGAKGITIFAVGFIHSGRDATAEKCLNDMVNNGAPGGKAFIVQDIESLHDVFRLMSRQLVTLE